MAKVLVLGSGLVGSLIAADLALSPGFRVSVADAQQSSLAKSQRRTALLAKSRKRPLPKLTEIVADCSSKSELKRLVGGFDLVVGALPSRFGFETLKTLIECGVRCVDISFMPEDFLELGALAKRKQTLAVADCGVAPGLSNMLAAAATRALAPCDRIEIMVGGLPTDRQWPFEYKAGFSPSDVIEEYVRPSRVVEHGKIVTREALTDRELIAVDGLGSIEAFLTDGLRSLATTLKVPHMKERTLRWPGHIELMRVFRETGFFSTKPIAVNGQMVRPLDLTAALLFPKWTFADGEVDLTFLRVVGEGTSKGRHVRMIFEMLDRADIANACSSMARTTAFPATSVARSIARGKLKARGVLAPEHLIGFAGIMKTVLADLKARGITVNCQIEEAALGARC